MAGLVLTTPPGERAKGSIPRGTKQWRYDWPQIAQFFSQLLKLLSQIPMQVSQTHLRRCREQPLMKGGREDVTGSETM